MSDDRLSSQQQAGASRPQEGGRCTVLVVANEELAGDAVGAVASEVRRTGVNGPPAVRVVSPALATSALKHQVHDLEDAMEPARERLHSSLRALRDAGIEASGQIGDSDPLQAIKDELLEDEEIERILILSHARDEESAYAEKKLMERVEREVEPPATELRVAGQAEDEEVVGRRRVGPGAIRGEEGRRISDNLPPLRTLDVTGMGVAILGTIALILIAAACSSRHEAGEALATVSGACTLPYLLAGGFFLINLGHVTALLLMSSVNYRGPFQRFVARTSSIGTPIAIAVSALVVFVL